ncbi:SDR family oxidoreductase [Luteibacter sp. E-22]|uniref:SDR family oxidoreductase n=1 Tax=Luteibacter sp. E-22 TaxID=3404050 RepID=UPI003CF5F954
MKFLVIGGSGLIGSKVVQRLRAKGHEAIAASPSSGVNTLTGEGLDEAMAGVDTVIDLANSPSFEDKAVLDFFQTSGRNLAAAERRAGIAHHVALSIVGTDRVAAAGSGYMRAKVAQETIVRESGVPYTIIHSTQFFEFLAGIAKSAAGGDTITLSTGYIQPIASDDVADAVVRTVLGKPANGVVEIAGPDKVRMSDLVGRFLSIVNDPHHVVGDAKAPYFGAVLADDSLLPGPDATLGKIDFHAWLKSSQYASFASAA